MNAAPHADGAVGAPAGTRKRIARIASKLLLAVLGLVLGAVGGAMIALFTGLIRFDISC